MTDPHAPRAPAALTPADDTRAFVAFLASKLRETSRLDTGRVLIEAEAEWRRIAAPPPSPRPEATQTADWIEDATHENGWYGCRCVYCGSAFMGHKRRVVCKLCAPRPEAEGETWDQSEDRVQREAIRSAPSAGAGEAGEGLDSQGMIDLAMRWAGDCNTLSKAVREKAGDALGWARIFGSTGPWPIAEAERALDALIEDRNALSRRLHAPGAGEAERLRAEKVDTVLIKSAMAAMERGRRYGQDSGPDYYSVSFLPEEYEAVRAALSALGSEGGRGDG
jgi:hypothetical protein